jgi:ketosteroid isomerase-like protein
MTLIDRDPLFVFTAYARAFEAAVASGEWAPVAECLAPDAVYEVRGAVPFAGVLEGRDAIVRGMRRSVDGFDRRVTRRRLEVRSIQRLDDARLHVELFAAYEKEGAPPVDFSVTSEVEVREGAVVGLTDRYDHRAGAALAWFGAHGEGLDPRYAA